MFVILLESIIPGQAAMGLTRGVGGDVPGTAPVSTRPTCKSSHWQPASPDDGSLASCRNLRLKRPGFWCSINIAWCKFNSI